MIPSGELPTLALQPMYTQPPRRSEDGTSSRHESSYLPCHEGSSGATNEHGPSRDTMQQKRKIESAPDPRDIAENTPLETPCKRICRDENKLASENSNGGSVLERLSLEKSSILDEIVGPHETEKSECAAGAGQAEVLWESPFQFAPLSFSTNVDQFVYTSTHHSVSLLSKMNEFRQSGLFCDVKLCGRDCTLGVICSSQVLSALSSVIKTRLFSGLGCASNLNFENIPHNILTQIVDFAYTGQIGLNESNVLAIYTAADFLDIEFLTNEALEFMTEYAEQFDGVSCYKVLRFVDQHHVLQPLIPIYKRRVFECVGDVFSSVECLTDLPLSLFLESDYIRWGSEIGTLRAADRWVSVDSNREQFVSVLLSRIRWDQIEQDQISLLNGAVKEYGNTAKSREAASETGILSLADFTRPKIGARSLGATGGFLFAYTSEFPSVLLDMETRKLKLLPKFPENGGSSPLLGNEVRVVESDDGNFHIFLQFHSSQTPVSKTPYNQEKLYKLFRLNIPENCWDYILDYTAIKLLAEGVLGGNLCTVSMQRNGVQIECRSMLTGKVEVTGLSKQVADSAVSMTSGLVHILHNDRSLTRFNPRDYVIVDIETNLPLANIRFQGMKTNGRGFAVARGVYFCLDSGRVVRSSEYDDTDVLCLLHDSIMFLQHNDEGDEEDEYDDTKSTFKVSRDRFDFSGRSLAGKFVLPREGMNRLLSCHFARAVVDALPDFC